MRHVDVVVEGEDMNDARWGIGDRGQPLRQDGACFGFDGADQPRHDVVENTNLLLGIALRRADKKVGDAAQYLDAARIAAGRQGSLELVDKRKRSRHGMRRLNTAT